MFKIEQALNEIKADYDQINLATSCLEHLEQISTVIGQNPSFCLEEQVAPVVQHYVKILGGDSCTRISVDSLSKRLDQCLRVAEEGFVDRVINAFRRASTGYDEMLEKTPKLVARALEKGVNNRSFVDAAWARIFANMGKESVTSEDIVRALDARTREAGMLRRYSNQVSRMIADSARLKARALKRYDDADEDSARQMLKDAKALSKEITQEIDTDFKNAKSTNVFALKKSGVEHLGSTIIRSAEQLARHDELNKMYETIQDVQKNGLVNNRIVRRLNPGMSRIMDRWASDHRYVYGAYRYLVNSVV